MTPATPNWYRARFGTVWMNARFKDGEWFDKAGLVIVPSEPTREMWAAGADAVVLRKKRHHDIVVKAVWGGMLAAAGAPQHGE